MEDLMQRTSTQSQQLDSNKKIGVEKFKNTKPPLLPKPQIVKLNPRNVPSSQIFLKKEDEVTKNLLATVSNNKCVTSKPLVISPKPKLPPKSGALNSIKPEIASNNLINSQTSECNSQEIDRFVRISHRKSIANEADSLVAEKGSSGTSVLSKCMSLPREESECLEENEGINRTFKNLIKDSKQLSELCKEVENCSKHSHILKNELKPQSTLYRRKKPHSATETVSVNSPPAHSSNDEALILLNACTKSKVENYFVKEQNSISDRRFQDFSFDEPKSFLHSYVSTCKQTKELIKCGEKSLENNSNPHSFLHRSKDQTALKLSKNKSLARHDSSVIDHGDGNANSQNELNNKIFSDSSNASVKRVDAFLESDRPSTSDITSFSKRFPWFGSFGKGSSKKDMLKKGRCLSQFYATSFVGEEQDLRPKNRTKSLPDIKQTRVIHDEFKNQKKADNLEVLRISQEYPHSDSDDEKDSLNQVESSSDKDSATLAYLKAKELMTSEEVFINVLKLLNVDFRNYVQFKNFESKNCCIPNHEIDKILNHLSQLQSLNEDILGDLRKRIENWESNPKIADVIVKKGAFLKMYTTYIQNFESQTNYLDECMIKYPKFGKVVREFEATDKCKKLTLKHYMLKPVQRIPQYRLLLNDYLKHLSESSDDYVDTLSALKIVCEVVDHANRNMSHGDKEGRLMHFQSLLSDFELIKPGRVLVKDGPLEKICRKTVRDRYFILLNDCLLHTTYSKQYLKIHQELPLSGMKICCNDDEKYPLSFTVHSITKSFILCAKNQAERKEWVETLQVTIEEHIKRQKTFLNVKIEEDSSFKLGKEAPVWVQDNKVTMCQICTAEFTALFRRHHCRGCGKVVCRNCGSNQAPLQYRSFKPDRVCDQCFELLLKDYEDSECSICENLKNTLSLSEEATQNEYLSIKARFIKYTSTNSWKKQKYIPPRLKEVSANDTQSVISGWLHRKSRKSWKMFWYVLKDHVLYVYKASEDVLALETIPVLGYKVERANIKYEDVDSSLVFSLVHPRQTPITFRAESQTIADRWFDALSAATKLNYLTDYKSHT